MNERIVNPISEQELERRWGAVRKEMRERAIDALIMQNNNDWLGGYVKWFTDVPAYNGYPRSVIFPASDLMTVVDMGSRGESRRLDGKDTLNRGVGEMFTTNAFMSVSYTDDYQGEIVARELKPAICPMRSCAVSKTSFPARQNWSMPRTSSIASRRSRVRRRWCWCAKPP